MSKIWFTADPHFGHANIIKSCTRPFVDVDSMNSTLWSNWNKIVKDEDHVYVLGDFVWYKRDIDFWCSNLYGKIHLILGNHDMVNIAAYSKQSNIVEITHLKILKINKRRYSLCHYPMMTWYGRRSGKGFHLFGHVHKTMMRGIAEGSLNVGVDMWNYRPISLEEVDTFLESDKVIKL